MSEINVSVRSTISVAQGSIGVKPEHRSAVDIEQRIKGIIPTIRHTLQIQQNIFSPIIQIVNQELTIQQNIWCNIIAREIIQSLILTHWIDISESTDLVNGPIWHNVVINQNINVIQNVPLEVRSDLKINSRSIGLIEGERTFDDGSIFAPDDTFYPWGIEQ